MAVNQYALVKGGVVENVILWDGESEWCAPEEMALSPIPGNVSVGVGYSFDGTSYAPPKEGGQ
ncbi:hypothetical protein [Burkholderia sp. BDU5]|uniref:hypothetical protein n=1 Tax=Burkholderia sp. BDU5 TaxID=1385590 RepID=UPI000A9E150A|nr:hypothetical protein [Burkholderia sp. BDU5]